MKPSEFLNESEQRLDPKCWKGYRKQGTKMKGDVRVNNCVKVGEDYSHDEYNNEAGMVDSNLETIKRAAEELDEVLGQDDNMAEWAQEKLAVVKSMLVAVKDYVVSQKSTGINPQVDEEFDMIESVIESLAVRNQVDAEVIWEDLESLTEDELYVFAVTQELVNEDWQKVNKRDKTDGMSKKAVNAYRRENPGSKLKTAVTTKPSKLKKGSKASKRRKSYCSRSKGQMNMHNISCAKTPDKAICKARRRWNC
jgi:DNA-binding transcriptional regulator YdaS (Cro superfamily)